MISLACLDTCLLRGGTPRETVQASVLTAKQAEWLGYSRYWLTEHHTRDVAHSTPEILIPIIAGATSAIRVGVAGTLLRYHNPYRIARSFKFLEALFPGRIDLGISRTQLNKATASLFHGECNSDELEIRVKELCGRLAQENRPPAFPQESVWMLGGLHGMRSAVQNGLAFSLCLFIGEVSQATARDILTEYTDTYKPSLFCSTSKPSIAVAGICAESFDRAEALFREATRAGLVHVTPTIIGSPEHCKGVLDGLAKACGTNEFVYLDLCARVEDRLRSMSLLAAEMGLHRFETLPLRVTPQRESGKDENSSFTEIPR